MTVTPDIKEWVWYAFVVFTLIGGVLWHVCRAESRRDFSMYHPLWFLDSEAFSDKGNRYRKRFIAVTVMALLSLVVWATL